MSLRYCSAKGCKSNSTNKKLSFFRFPNDEERCAVWIEKCNRTDLIGKGAKYCYNNLRLCSNHFEQSMFSSMSKNKLKREATPTAFRIGENAHTFTQQIEVAALPGRSTPHTLKPHGHSLEEGIPFRNAQHTLLLHDYTLKKIPSTSTKSIQNQTTLNLKISTPKNTHLRKRSRSARRIIQNTKKRHLNLTASEITAEQFSSFCDKNLHKEFANFIKAQIIEKVWKFNYDEVVTAKPN